MTGLVAYRIERQDLADVAAADAADVEEEVEGVDVEALEGRQSLNDISPKARETASSEFTLTE